MADERGLYSEAGKKATELGKSTHLKTTVEECDRFYHDFQERFAPEALKMISDEDLPWHMFASRGDEKTYMSWWLEFQEFSKDHLGRISGATAFVYPLHMSNNDKTWKTGTAAKQVDVDEAGAVKIAIAVRDALVAGADIISSAMPGSVESYREMAAKLRKAVGDIYGRMWVQKYYQFIFPEYFATYYSEDFQRHILLFFGIAPDEDSFVRSGQIAMIQRNTNLCWSQFGEMTHDNAYINHKIPRFIRLGTSAENVDYFSHWLDTKTANVGWNELGSLKVYEVNGRIDKKKLNSVMLNEYYPDKKKNLASRKAGEVRLFYESDSRSAYSTVFVAMKGQRLLGLGEVAGEYEFREKEPLAHTIPVVWHTCFDEEEALPNNNEFLQTTCKEFEDPGNLIYLYRKYYNELDHPGTMPIPAYKANADSVGREEDISDRPLYDTEDEADFGGFERNRIVFGAPGTGKSYRLNEDKKVLLQGCEENYERVTFYPDYSYSQFVGTYKPVMDEDGRSICYSYVPGPFLRVLVKALKSGMSGRPKPYLLLLEEINRAKMASVFGDIFQLLDRNENGSSIYEISTGQDMKRYLRSELGGDESAYEHIRIPNNMFIWATMNSADQGVFPMDTAFKRRWSFEYIGIDENDQNVYGVFRVRSGKEAMDVEWNMLRKAINERLTDLNINEDKLLGPYFIEEKYFKTGDDGRIEDETQFLEVFKSKVLMYLFEDAARQYRTKLFVCEGNNRYSSICERFDVEGVTIFGQDFADKLRLSEDTGGGQEEEYEADENV